MSAPIVIPPAPPLPLGNKKDSNGWTIIETIDDLPPIGQRVFVFAGGCIHSSALWYQQKRWGRWVGWNGEYFKDKTIGVVVAWRKIDLPDPDTDNICVPNLKFTTCGLEIDTKGNVIK